MPSTETAHSSPLQAVSDMLPAPGGEQTDDVRWVPQPSLDPMRALSNAGVVPHGIGNQVRCCL
jgi:hypothetical protein